MQPAPPLLAQLKERQPRIPATGLLIAANCLVFVAMVWAGAGYWHTSNGVQLAWGANFGPATKDGEWWRLGSALFLHFGLFHLGMNMLSLWDGGRLVERMYGSGRFLLVYFASGLAGNLLSLIIQGDRAVSGGASGAIFGIYGALMVHLWHSSRSPGFPKNDLVPTEGASGEVSKPGAQPARTGNESREQRQLLWGAAVFSTLAILLGFTIKGIDNAAHIGGLVGGLLAGMILARSGSGPRPLPAWTRRTATALFGLWIALMVTFMPQPRYRWSEEVQARGEIHEFMGEDARIAAQLEAILGSARQGASFDELAGRVESSVANPYADSFQSLSRLHLDPTAPSAPALARVRQYAEERRDASLALAEGLRAKDWEQIRDVLEKVARAGKKSSNKSSAQSGAQSAEPTQ